jgi:hypothetical protein
MAHARKAREADYLTVYSAEPVAAPAETDSPAVRLTHRRRSWAQFLDQMLRHAMPEQLIDLHNKQGWPDLDTAPAPMTPQEQEARAIAAQRWGDEARAELMERYGHLLDQADRQDA